MLWVLISSFVCNVDVDNWLQNFRCSCILAPFHEDYYYLSALAMMQVNTVNFTKLFEQMWANYYPTDAIGLIVLHVSQWYCNVPIIKANQNPKIHLRKIELECWWDVYTFCLIGSGIWSELLSVDSKRF